METLEILELVKNSDSHWGSEHESLPMFFDYSAFDYLEFAEKDFSLDFPHSCVNALSNAKRAIDCQIETLIIGFGLKKIAKNEQWNLPKKLDFLNELGILAPRVLKKINKVRNYVEHEFIKPNKNDVEDFIDIVALFLESTKVYVNSFVTQVELSSNKLPNRWLRITLNYNENNFVIVLVGAPTKEDYIINFNDSNYMTFLKEYIKGAYKFIHSRE